MVVVQSSWPFQQPIRLKLVVKFTSASVIFPMTILADHKPIGNRFRLNCGKNNMSRICNDDCSCAPPVGGIDQLFAVSSIGNDTLDRGRLWTDDGNHPASGHNVAKTNVDQLNVHGGRWRKGVEIKNLVFYRIYKIFESQEKKTQPCISIPLNFGVCCQFVWDSHHRLFLPCNPLTLPP